MKFTEASLERAFIELLANEGFSHQLGNTLVRSVEEVIIEEDLINYLLSKYASKQLTSNEAKSIALQLKTLPSSDLYESNKTIMRWLSDGSLLGVSGGGSGGRLLFWKTDAEKDFHRFALPNIARDMDLHTDGIQVATAHHDRTVRITKLTAKPA